MWHRTFVSFLAAAVLLSMDLSAATVTVGSASANCGSQMSLGLSITESEQVLFVEFVISHPRQSLRFFGMQPGGDAASWSVDEVEEPAGVRVRLVPPTLRSVSGNVGAVKFDVPSSSIAGTANVEILNVRTQTINSSFAGTGSLGAVTFECKNLQTPPPPPPAPEAIAQSPVAVELRWSPIQGASRYRVFRGTELVFEGSETRFVDQNRTGSTEYCYTVRSLGESGESRPSPAVCVRTPASCMPPAGTSALVAAAEGSSGARISWNAIQNATGYRLTRDGTQIFSGPALSFNDSGLTAGVRYCYGLQATSSCGDGPVSQTACVTTAPSCTPPTQIPAVSTQRSDASSVLVSWTGVPQTNVYSLLRNGSVVFDGSFTQFSDVFLKPATRYCYVVRAANSCGATQSQESCATTLALPAQKLAFTHLAGPNSGPGSRDGKGTEARFHFPRNLVVDAAGNIFIADEANHVIRRMTPQGVVTTFAGSPGQHGITDGTGPSARFRWPIGIAIDNAGNLYVTDSGHTIRKVTPDAVVTTIAGSPGRSGSVDGTGSEARFTLPSGIAVDASGNLYVTDDSHTIRKITPSGQVSTFAGTAGASGSVDAVGSAARFGAPRAIAIDLAGNLYVGDRDNQTIRKVTPGAAVTTLAGSPGQAGSTDGAGGNARFNGPVGIAVDTMGNIFVADRFNHAIRKVTPDGVVTTLAGFPQTGSIDATGSAARFRSPRGVGVDSSGNVFVADSANHSIRKVTSDGTVTTLGGAAEQAGNADGLRSQALFRGAEAGVVDAFGNVYVADSDNHTIRKISPQGLVTTLAGVAGQSGSVDGPGPAARFNNPSGLGIDEAGNLFVADTNNHTIRKVTPDGVVSTLAGSAGQGGSSDGPGSLGRFQSPLGVSAGPDGSIYVADTGNHTIRKVTPSGLVSTIAGSAGQTGNLDGVGLVARFNTPTGLAVSPSGAIYVADSSNHVIRQLSPSGQTSTLAGTKGVKGGVDGIGSQARFNFPGAIAIDRDGVLFVADRDNHTIRKVTPAGQVLTLAGSSQVIGSEDGSGSESRFIAPRGIAVDDAGNVFVIQQLAVRQGALCPGSSRCPSPRRRGAQPDN